MKKALLLVLAMAICVVANALELNPNLLSDKTVSTQMELQTLSSDDVFITKKVSRSENDNLTWSDWKYLCVASFPENLITFITNVCTSRADTIPQYNQPFIVRERTCSDGSSQLRFDNPFGNNINITIDVAIDETISCNAPTGIKIKNPDSNWYDNFYLSLSGKYLKGANKLIINQLWLFVNDMLGFNYGISTNIILGEEVEVVFEAEIPYVPSNKNSATINIKRSTNVAFYRTVILEENSIKYSDLYNLMNYQPLGELNYQYVDYYTENSFEVTNLNKIRTSIILIPFNHDQQAVGDYIFRSIFYNKPCSGSWRSIGTGTLRDATVYSYFCNSYDELNSYKSAVETKVEIEVMEGNENIFRIKNPYTTSHPFADKLNFIDSNDDFYLVFDATDPSRVYMPERLSGLKSQNGSIIDVKCSFLSYINEMSQEDIDKSYGNRWGKYADRRIFMPKESSNLSVCDNLPDFVLELPDYIDYSFSKPIIWNDEAGDIAIRVDNISSNVSEMRFAFVPTNDYQENRYFPERYIKSMSSSRANDINTYHCVNHDGSGFVEIHISASYLPIGNYHVVVVSVDKNGSVHNATFSENTAENVIPIDRWEDAGLVKVYDNSILASFDNEYVAEMVVNAKKSPGNDHLYLLVDYYKKWAEATNTIELFNADNADLYIINANDPNGVFVTSNINGLRKKQPMLTGLNISSEYATIMIENYVDWFNNGIFGKATFDSEGTLTNVDFSEAPMINLVYNKDQSSLLAANYGNTKFEFNYKDSALDAIEINESNAPIEWFNLQGVRINNPSNGIFIRKQGSTVRKVMIP